MGEENKNEITDTYMTEDNKNIEFQSRKSKKKDEFKEKECSVLNYNKCSKNLDILFDGFGIRLKEVDELYGNTVMVKYKGTIGHPDFQIKL